MVSNAGLFVVLKNMAIEDFKSCDCFFHFCLTTHLVLLLTKADYTFKLVT